MTETEPQFTIGDIAKKLNIHQRTLRIYDEEKILIPKRTKTNRRYYNLEDLKKGDLIQYMTSQLGLNLAGIKIIFYLLGELQVTIDNGKYLIEDAAKEMNCIREVAISKRGRKPKEKVNVNT